MLQSAPLAKSEDKLQDDDPSAGCTPTFICTMCESLHLVNKVLYLISPRSLFRRAGANGKPPTFANVNNRLVFSLGKHADASSGICFQSNYTILRLNIPDNPSQPCLSCTKQWCLNQNLPICAGASLGNTNPDTATGKEGDVEARCFRTSCSELGFSSTLNLSYPCRTRFSQRPVCRHVILINGFWSSPGCRRQKSHFESGFHTRVALEEK